MASDGTYGFRGRPTSHALEVAGGVKGKARES